MSSVVISGDTSGAITLSAPAVAGTNTLTLPAKTATIATLTTPSFATTIGVGGATASTSGAGITFPATQSASTDANTLDDYEEGTWTPAVSSTSGSISSYTSQGTYTKVGRMVNFTCRINITSVGSASGNLVWANLPFTCGTTNQQIPFLMREGALTGQCYQTYLDSGSTGGVMQSLTGSALTWATNYAYYTSGYYPSAD